jgi:hypothetical protein
LFASTYGDIFNQYETMAHVARRIGPMVRNVFKAGPFAGVPISDAFAEAAQQQSAVIYRLPTIQWPANAQPTVTPLGKYVAGTKITNALSLSADVLIILYTDQETMALLDVMTGNPAWDASAKADWCLYAHNFDKFKSLISNTKANDTLAGGAFGLLSAMTIAGKRVVLYKSELHPKQDGPGLPFVPVIQQLISELAPNLVLTTGTAGAIGSRIGCGDVAISAAGRLHCQKNYPKYPSIATLTTGNTELTSDVVKFDREYLQYAATHLTSLSLPGLAQCYQRLRTIPGYSFVEKNTLAPAIYQTGVNPVPGPEPMVILSADYMTTDDTSNAEHLQPLGIMNDTDDAFVFFAINQMPEAKRPHCLSVRNASEPQIEHSPFPSSTSPADVVDILKNIAGTIFGIYQYCTALNSAFACWGIVAGL